ncbi:MAG: polysaccharide pyruvyl transferase family protein, partial [Bacteroidales bacterium]|nr:polysaccharide pyruvyl transferase family protein [Bacteroidales bacterium]
IKRKRRNRQLEREESNDQRKFNLFRNKHLGISEKTYFSYKELSENPPTADVYIAGSDTVWDFLNRKDIKRTLPLCRAYFLDFGNPKAVRMSYAASINAVSIYKDVLETISQYLKNFRYITVREKQSLAILKNDSLPVAEWVCDPTLLHNAGVYRGIYKKEMANQEYGKYCLLYKINESGNFSTKKLYKWAEKRGLKVIYAGEGQTDHYKKNNASVFEWLSLVDNAECVITNSYHGACFSIIFRKNFAVFPLTGEFKNANIRFNSLFEILEVEERFIFKNDLSVLDKPIDWESVEQKINCFQADNVLLRL